MATLIDVVVFKCRKMCPTVQFVKSCIIYQTKNEDVLMGSSEYAVNCIIMQDASNLVLEILKHDIGIMIAVS